MTAPQKPFVEKVAFVLWRDESIRAAKRKRTFEQWLDESDETRDRWCRSAKAAVAACRAVEMYLLLAESQESIGGDWRERRDTLLAKLGEAV